MKHANANSWWGSPKKFSTSIENRKISWLELFYDLVYVIAISKITHHFGEHINFTGLLDYTYLFCLIFWGWLNGSLFHDLHGTTGLRTNLMTIWQMMIVAALVVVLGFPEETRLFNATIVIIIMQIFITYLWWSVGIYDKEHRKLNLPYTICFLTALCMIVLTLFLPQSYIRIAFYLSLFFNFIPPFIMSKKMESNDFSFSLSSNMIERFGLLTIILFGEVVTGLINGVSDLNGNLHLQDWLNFGLAILIIFSLWWISFTVIADRETTKGWIKSNFMAYFYIPTLMSLGAISVGFNGVFKEFSVNSNSINHSIVFVFSLGLSIFLAGIIAISEMLDYPEDALKTKKAINISVLLASLFFAFIAVFNFNFSLFAFLTTVFAVLIVVIFLISKKRIE